MKKALCFIISLILILTLFSCSKDPLKNNEQVKNLLKDSDKTDADFLNEIYEEDTGIATAEYNFNHKNTIYNSEFFDESVPKKEKLVIDGIELELDYYKTLYYPINDRKMNQYIVNGVEKRKLSLFDDGSIALIQYPFDYIEIPKTALPDEVLPLLKDELSKWVDISKYQHVYIPSIPENIENGFGRYSFMFYNSVEGYFTDCLSLNVSDKGALTGLVQNNLNVSNITLNVNEDLVDYMLTLKLKDIYSTENSDYKSYKISSRDFDEPKVVIYDGRLYIRYIVIANFKRDVDKSAYDGFLQNILIPVDIITAK